jgi:hypothetical protein
MSKAKSIALALLFGCSAGLNGQSRAAWMQEAQWGVMTHYLADWQAQVHGLTMSVDQWNKLVDGLDAEGMAKQLQSVGARYYQISIGQNSGYYLSPNAAYDKVVGIQPSKCSQPRPDCGSLRCFEHAGDQVDGIFAIRCSRPGQGRRRRTGVAQRSQSQPGVSTQMGTGDPRMVRAMGEKGGRLVV